MLATSTGTAGRSDVPVLMFAHGSFQPAARTRARAARATSGELTRADADTSPSAATTLTTNPTATRGSDAAEPMSEKRTSAAMSTETAREIATGIAISAIRARCSWLMLAPATCWERYLDA